jgi:hypothetical protein
MQNIEIIEIKEPVDQEKTIAELWKIYYEKN